MGSGQQPGGDGWCTSQFNVVLLGGRNSGKNCVGNLLLGKEEFVTRERTSCSRRLAAVAGRWLSVVDTPGWWCDFSVQDTSELVKREIVSSVSLCSPGPHVFLITIKASSAFSEKRRRAVKEHVGLLGAGVWKHCMLVFTSADRMKHTTAEECVDRGGRALSWLSEMCGRRCHSVLLSDDSDVTELLVKMEKLVMENGNRVFEMEGNMSQVAAKERRRVEEKAQLRFMRMKQQRSLMREKLRPVTNIRMVLLGAKGSGKTSVMNTILGRDSSSLQPLRRTAQCVAESGVVFGRQVTVVDTPGWWMNYFCGESPIFDQREMVLSLSLCPPGPHVFLLVVRLDRAFTEKYRRAAQEHLELISQHIWSRVIVLFSFGDWLGNTTTELYIESEGEPLHWLIERCSNRYHVLNSKTKGDGFQVRELIGKIEEVMTGSGRDWHYEIDRKELEQLEERMRRERERAKERLMKKEKQRQMARSLLEKLNPQPELSIVLVGGRKTGKSSCGNTILSRETFDTDTQTTSCTEKRGQIHSKTVSVLDTPGCFSVNPDLLVESCAILLVVNISSSFNDSHREALEKQLEAGGDQLWSRTMVLFSFGDCLGGTSIEQRIESEGEALQRIVDKCGNRYHVFNNKQWEVGDQVKELIHLMEEMLAGERLDATHSGDHMWKSVPSAGEELPDTVTLCKKDLKEFTSSRQQLSHDLSESATSSPTQSGSEDSDAAGIVAVPTGRARGQAAFTIVDRDRFMSFIASVLSGDEGLRWPTINLPVRFHPHLRLNSERRMLSFTPGNQTVFLVSSEAQRVMLPDQDTISVHSLCHPALRERTLRRLCESGGLQALIDQWGSSSLEELEAFIDWYFEMVWEETMGSFQSTETDAPSTEQDSPAVEEEEVLSSIDRKLSKLELLEEIKSDLAELRQSLEGSWKAIQDLRDKTKQDPNDPCL